MGSIQVCCFQEDRFLTRAVLHDLPPHPGGPGAPRLIYGESCRLAPATLLRQSITFKQTPYEIKAR